MDINQRLSSAIEKQDWELVKEIQAELSQPVQAPAKKRGRPKKDPSKQVVVKKAKKKMLTKQAKKTVQDKKDLLERKTYEYSPPVGTPGYERPNLFEDDLTLDTEDLGIAMTRDISRRRTDRESEYIDVTCAGCGFKTRVLPVVTIRGVEAAGTVRNYKCDKCLNR